MFKKVFTNTILSILFNLEIKIIAHFINVKAVFQQYAAIQVSLQVSFKKRDHYSQYSVEMYI